MAASGSILPIPKWYFVDNNGQALGAGYLYTRRSVNKSELKPVFQDAGLTIPYTYTTTPIGPGIRIDANGTTGPIFWNPDEPYYIFVNDMNGNLVWDMDGFGPAIAGGGGGGSITTVIDIENIVPNNTFYRFGTGATGTPANQEITPVPAFITIAPGAHTGLTGMSTAPGGSPAPDICFIKNNIAATDKLSFEDFVLGGNELVGDATPTTYLHYESNAAVGETYKFIQFPITSGAQSLSNMSLNGKIWARWNSGSGTTLKIYLRQFYGSGTSASADQRSAPAVIALNTTTIGWEEYPFSITVPNASGKTLGQCGNDGLFFQVEYPLNLACNIDFVKPSAYVTDTAIPDVDFNISDQTEALVNDFRTGDVRSSLNSFAPFGWVAMNDGTIGSAASASTSRANKDTFPLYKLLYTSVSDTYAPVVGGRTGGGTTDAECLTDYLANKPITLTRMLGRALAESGSGAGLTTRTLGEYLGEESHLQTINEMPAHVHNSPGGVFVIDTIAGGIALNTGGTTTGASAVTGSVNGQGAISAFNVMQPTSFVNMFIKL